MFFCLFDALVGFLFSNIAFSRGIMPFGIAYATVGSFSGFLGVFVGHLLAGQDLLRVLTSCFMARVFRLFLPSFAQLNRPLAHLLFTLWGTMLGGLAGFYFSQYTPKENVAFMVNGLLSGGLAWLFTVAASAFTQKRIGTPPLRYVCSALSFAFVVAGLMHFGGLWVSAGRMAVLFLLLCLGDRCSFFYAFSTACLVGLCLCLFSAAELPFFFCLILGALLSSALRIFEKYGQILSYAIASPVVWLLSERSFSLFSFLFTVLMAGLLFLTVPRKLMSLLTDGTVPLGGLPLFRRSPARFRISRRGKRYFSDGVKACQTCPRRILCYTRYRTQTLAAIASLRSRLNAQTVPSDPEFSGRCSRFSRLVRELRAGQPIAFGVHYAKAFAQKEGELFCGDTAGGFRTADDRFVFTLADGMGCGTAAARQSIRATRMMETLAKSGIAQEDILKILNSSLLSSQEETVLGVDVASVDLKNGVCDLFKVGAAPTFILRRGIVYEIGSDTLPLGMLERVDLRHERCTLADDDYLILVSDGVLGKDKKWLLEYLNRSAAHKDCVSLADGILREAKRVGRNRSDDITVLAVQIKKNTAA